MAACGGEGWLFAGLGCELALGGGSRKVGAEGCGIRGAAEASRGPAAAVRWPEAGPRGSEDWTGP